MQSYLNFYQSVFLTTGYNDRDLDLQIQSTSPDITGRGRHKYKLRYLGHLVSMYLLTIAAILKKDQYSIGS